MVRITTRGGIAKELEYENNHDLISKPQSDSRIVLLFLLIAILLSTFFQVLVILSVFFGTIPNLSKNIFNNFHQKYILSIMENGNVQLISLDNKYKSIKLDFSFPQETKFKFVYYDMQNFYFLHTEKNKYDTVISMENNDPLGSSQYISKNEKFFGGSQFNLPQRFSIVQVGSYLWLFGK